MSARGEVVQQVASAYLHVIAAASEVDNAKGSGSGRQVLLDHAHAAHEAGVVANLDELRARVQLQAQQLALIAAQNALEKNLILLKREIGLDPGQKISSPIRRPTANWPRETPEEVRAIAYKNRQDYQTPKSGRRDQGHPRRLSQPAAAQPQLRRLLRRQPGGRRRRARQLYRQGTLSLPLFREAKLRGDTEAAQANLDAVNAQLDDLRGRIDQQVRSALLDVTATARLVEVARSNVGLATRALADETDRVNAGVDDNLPLVTAQATLAAAQSGLVESLYQYNLSKLAWPAPPASGAAIPAVSGQASPDQVLRRTGLSGAGAPGGAVFCRDGRGSGGWRGRARIAISGGSTPKAAFRAARRPQPALAQAVCPGTMLDLYWVDERCVLPMTRRKQLPHDPRGPAGPCAAAP
jgi:hypothetical protein